MKTTPIGTDVELSLSRRRSLSGVLALLACVLGWQPSASYAQDANVGKQLYNTPLVSGQLSCSAGACHGPDPLGRQNRIQNGDTPGGIGLAINTIAQMAFLRGQVDATQATNLAAYIANPASATGAPMVQLSVASLSYAPTLVGQTAPQQQFTLSNVGSATLAVSAISATATDFAVTHNCSNVAVAASCNVAVTFAPTTSGAQSAALNIAHNASGGISTVVLTGTGTVEPIAAVSPISINFGDVALGAASATQTITISNAGNAILRLINLSISGDAFAQVGGSCMQGTSILPASACTIGLRFTPQTEGVMTGALFVDHNAAGGSSVVTLSGTGFVAAPETRLMTEYIYAPLNYYFITSRDSDKLQLDHIDGFQRTGLQFKVFATQAVGMEGISRYYFDKAALQGMRGTHFYTLLANEKAGLSSLNPGNLQLPLKPYNEGTDSYAYPPTVEGVGGSCSVGLVPVYRMFRGNARFPDDPNHRFTANNSVYQSMVAAGWDNEGVKFCVPE